MKKNVIPYPALKLSEKKQSLTEGQALKNCKATLIERALTAKIQGSTVVKNLPFSPKKSQVPHTPKITQVLTAEKKQDLTAKNLAHVAKTNQGLTVKTNLGLTVKNAAHAANQALHMTKNLIRSMTTSQSSKTFPIAKKEHIEVGQTPTVKKEVLPNAVQKNQNLAPLQEPTPKNYPQQKQSHLLSLNQREHALMIYTRAVQTKNNERTRDQMKKRTNTQRHPPQMRKRKQNKKDTHPQQTQERESGTKTTAQKKLQRHPNTILKHESLKLFQPPQSLHPGWVSNTEPNSLKLRSLFL